MVSAVHQLLAQQPPEVFDRLFSISSSSSSATSPATFVAKTLFQSLSLLATNYVMRLLFITNPVQIAELRDWCTELEEHARVVDELLRMNVLKRVSSETGLPDAGSEHVLLHADFSDGLKTAISAPREPWTDEGDAVEPEAVAVEIIERNSRTRWDMLLRVLVGLDAVGAKSHGSSGMSGSIESFVRKTGLMSESGPGNVRRKLTITAAGYEYMLKGYAAQVWVYVNETLGLCSVLEEAVSLLCMLAHCVPGQGYRLSRLSALQQQLVLEFAQLGLVYLSEIARTGVFAGIQVFYPARSSVSLLFGATAATTAGSAATLGGGGMARLSKFSMPSKKQQILAEAPVVGLAGGSSSQVYSGGEGDGDVAALDELSIIVETNHQVVAYLTSELHLALLKLFVDFHVALPNMAIGRLTRAKAKEAFRIGIKAEQIVQFLCVHAHPLTASQQPVIPLNVVDQLVLWENESERLRGQDAVFVDFSLTATFSKDKYRAVIEAARGMGALLWSLDSGMQACFDPALYTQHIEPFVATL